MHNRKGLRQFERATTATAGCLVDIIGSLKTTPTLKFKASGYELLSQGDALASPCTVFPHLNAAAFI